VPDLWCPEPGARGAATTSALARTLAAAVLATAVLAGCGGDDDDDAGTDAAVTTLATTVPDPQGQVADPQAANTTAVVADGEQTGYLVVVDPDVGLVTIDAVDYLTGAEAVAAAAAAGAPTPTFSYVRDTDPGSVAEVPVDPAVTVSVLAPGGGELAIDLTGLAAAFSPDAPPDQLAYTTTPYRITVADGVVTDLEQLPAPS
jgi:hypothetical protein